MIRLIRKSTRLTMTAMLALLLVSAGCKSKKKAMEARNAEERARVEAEARLSREREEAERRRLADEERARREAEGRERAPYERLDTYFNAVSNAANPTAANSSINEALAMFASPDAPVLIVISEEDGQKDYDRPTTIRNYLNYLKDQKKKADRIGTLQFDNAGRITEVELIKQ